MYKVVIIEDEPWIMKELKIIFDWEKYGFEIVESFDYAEEAIEYLAENVVDVVFSDINLPGLSGLEFIQMLRQRNSTIKFVIVSGYSDFSYMQTAIRMEVFDYLLKPISKDKANEILERLKERLDIEKGIVNEVEDEIYDTIHNTKFQNLVKYINNNYSDKLSLQSLAERFGLNMSYCSQLFNKYYNCGFSDYIIKIRMTKAANLLIEGTFSISEVAEMVCYEYTYFNKLFKEYYGVTPYQYKTNKGI